MEALKLAVQLGAPVNYADPNGDTALHIAATRRRDLIVQALADSGAVLDARNHDGETPLAEALKPPPPPKGSGQPDDYEYLLKHTSRTVHAQVAAVDYRLDIATLDHQPASTLTLNGIGVVEIETAQPLAVDLYSQSRITGSFVLIDPVSNSTAAAGMIRKAVTGAKTSIAPDLDRAEAHRQLARVAEFFDLTAPDGAVAQHVRRALAALEESDE